MIYEDGYRITVEWSDEDKAWIARITGMKPVFGEPIGDGATIEEALCCLLCAVACTAEAVI